MHVGAEGTFQVVVIHYYHLSVLVAPRGTALDVDFLHSLDIRVLGEVELSQTKQGLAIFGKKEIVILLFLSAIEGDCHRLIVWKIAGLGRSHDDLHLGRNVVEPAHLALDSFHCIGRRRLSRAAETYKDKKNQGTSQKHH